MAHHIESAMFAITPAWHKLGSVLDHTPTSAEAIIASGLDWTVNKRETLTYGMNEAGEKVPVLIPDQFALVRDSDNSVLSIVGNKYNVVQNREAFDFVDGVFDEEVHYESAGSLKEGKIVWLLAKLNGQIDVGGGDIVEKYLLFTHGHDGKTPISVTITPTRVVCWNTLSIALKEAKSMFRIRHSNSTKSQMEKAKALLGDINKTYDLASNFFETLGKIHLTEAQIEELNKGLFFKVKNNDVDNMQDDDYDNEDMSSQVKNQMELITDLWKGQAIGSHYVSMQGTAWGWLNAVTEGVDHHWSLSRTSVDPSNQLYNMWLGRGQQLKTQAVTMLQDVVKGRGKVSVLIP